MAKRNGNGVWIAVVGGAVLFFALLLFVDGDSVETSVRAGMTGEEVLGAVSDSCLASNEAIRKLLAEKTEQAREAALKAASQCAADSDAALEIIPASAWANDHCRAYIETQGDMARWNISDGARLAQRPASGTLMSESDSNAGRRGLALFGMADYHLTMCTAGR